MVLLAWSWRSWAGARYRPDNLVAAGAVSGVMGTATSIGGAPMALIWQGHQGRRLRGTMSAFFMVGSAISVAAAGLSPAP